LVSTVGRWLVLGGAALVIVCVAVALSLTVRLLRRSEPASAAEESPDGGGTRLEAALARGVGEDELVALVLGEAVETAGADAAAIVLEHSDGRHTGSAGLDDDESRFLVEELVRASAASATHHRYELVRTAASGAGISDGLLVPVVDGSRRRLARLGVYWRACPAGLPESRLAGLERLASALAPALARDEPAPEPEVAVAQPPPTEVDRLRRLGELAATIELGELLPRLVVHALEESGADAVAVGVRDGEGALLGDSRGLSVEEAAWLAPTLEAEAEIATITRYLDLATGVPGADAQIAATIAVPLLDLDGESVGSLVAAWRRDIAGEADQRLERLERLLEDTRAALGNAIRFGRLQALSVRDAETGLRNARYFAGALAAACARAEERSEPLSLLAVAADPRLASDRLEQAVAAAAETFATVVAGSGEPCRVGATELAAILEGAPAERGTELLTDVLAALEAAARALAWSGVAVERGPGEGPDELHARARERLRGAGAAELRTAEANEA
jgi:GGDEF domain-containing protein